MTADTAALAPAVELLGPPVDRSEEILTPRPWPSWPSCTAASTPARRELLAARQPRQARFDAGERPDFLAETKAMRDGDWRVAPIPADLLDRRVEITGPVDRKMIINALNSGAKVFMADFEDATSPTWANIVEGQVNLKDRWAGQLGLADPRSGKSYALKREAARS